MGNPLVRRYMPPDTGPRTDGARDSRTDVLDGPGSISTTGPKTSESYEVTARKVLQKVADRPPDPPLDPAVGERFPFLGTPRTVALSRARDEHAVVDDALVLARSPGTGSIDVRSALRELYRREARRYYARRLVDLARRFDRDPPAVELFDAPTRLVDCRERPPVRVNWRAIMAPPQVVDHALVHALAHFERASHTEAFEELVVAHRPELDDERWLDPMGIALRLPP